MLLTVIVEAHGRDRVTLVDFIQDGLSHQGRLLFPFTLLMIYAVLIVIHADQWLEGSLVKRLFKSCLQLALNFADNVFFESWIATQMHGEQTSALADSL